MTAPVTSMSVLAKLTADVMKEKRTAARGTLTPVAGEGHTPASFAASIEPLPDVGAPFPWEHPTENIVMAIRNIRKELGHIDEALVAVERIIQVPTPFDAEVDASERVLEQRMLSSEPGINRPKMQKEIEAAADARAKDPAFADRFNQLKKDAEEATYQQGVVQVEAHRAVTPETAGSTPPSLTTSGWVCPTHGKATTKTSARTQKSYTGCPDCNLFER